MTCRRVSVSVFFGSSLAGGGEASELMGAGTKKKNTFQL